MEAEITNDDWVRIRDGDPRLREIYNRHYSARKYKDGRRPKKCVGPGEYMALITPNNDAIFIWRKFISMDLIYGDGINCAVFRNEGHLLSSELIKQAMNRARSRWPRERLYTYINNEKIKSTNPGYCFIKAGWKKVGKTKGGLIVLEFLL